MDTDFFPLNTFYWLQQELYDITFPVGRDSLSLDGEKTSQSFSLYTFSGTGFPSIDFFGEVSFSDVLLVGARMRTSSSSSTTTRIDVVLVTRDSPEDEGAGWKKNKKVCLCELLTR